ncbi:MAG: hypothetical protein ABIA66_00540 [Candidatus Omnitrophota bacterium]
MAVDKNTQKELLKKKTFNINDLSEKNRNYFTFVKDRILELQRVRQDVFGVNLEEVWKDADKDYVPHKLSAGGKKIVATDDLKGWRGSMVTLGKEDGWQFDAPRPNPYIKIQTALSILVDRNPSGVFLPLSKKFEKINNLVKQLYEKNWEMANSKQQLKLFMFNTAKYGWGIARTYPLKIKKKVRNIVEYNEDDPENSKWEEKEVTEYNDVFRENLDPWNAWIDDAARPNNFLTMKDWAWRRVYSWDQAEQEFGKYDRWKYVRPGGNIQDKLESPDQKKITDTNLVEIVFYENKLKDLFMVMANGVPIIIEPLPISDARGSKKLSCWHAYWNLRHAESPYGIGIYEAIRNDVVGLNRIRCMSIDQLTLSIYKSFFYSGTTSLTEGGTIKIAPGVGKQVADPKSISWLNVPGPGREAWEGVEMFQKDIDESSGITDPLMGEVTGKTAFEIAQAKESALKRLKTPLDNICDALEIDGYLTVALMQMIYSIPEVIKISDPEVIQEYLEEIKGDTDLFERGENGEFEAKVYREFQLGLEKDETDTLVESQNSKFFRIKPSSLNWEGIINIKPQSILTPSKELDKALTLEMTNVINPMMGQTTLEIDMAKQMGADKNLDDTTFGKTIKQILKKYDADPKEWLPNAWMKDSNPLLKGSPVITQENKVMSQMMAEQGQQPRKQQPMPAGAVNPMAAQAPTPTAPQRPQGVAGGMFSGLVNKLTGRSNKR